MSVGALAHGRIEFHHEPVVNRRSGHMGVHEHEVCLQPRQVGTFRLPQRITGAMVQRLHSAVSHLLDDDEIIIDCDHQIGWGTPLTAGD